MHTYSRGSPCATQPSATTTTASTIASQSSLLQRFIVQGFVALPPSRTAAASVHADVAAALLACGLQEHPTGQSGLAMLGGDAAGNNILHAAPALAGPALLESPALASVLRGLLGNAYRLHPHRRAHVRRRGDRTTMWHEDSYKGTYLGSGRRHAPHDVMVCYYPQETTLEMGPTELLPGTQYVDGWKRRVKENGRKRRMEETGRDREREKRGKGREMHATDLMLCSAWCEWCTQYS